MATASIIIGTMVGGLAVGGSTASAAIACTTRTTTKAFSAWGDTNPYFVVPDGAFEATPATWVTRNATTTAGNEPWKVLGSAHAKSLKLSPGATASTAQFCVASAEDALRFFVKAPGVAGTQLLVHIDVISGVNRATNDYAIAGNSSGWAPSQRIMLPDIRDSSGKQNVTITFTVVGNATWYLDDVMIDPWRLF
ncbi:MAG: hypothetical protein ABMA25_16190 [Ilumatobacteraceae bacterium]